MDVLLHPLAARILQRLQPDLRKQVKGKLQELRNFPERGKHLRRSRAWTLRIGDYRAIYEIQKEENRILVLFIGHRKDVYDDFSKLE